MCIEESTRRDVRWNRNSGGEPADGTGSVGIGRRTVFGGALASAAALALNASIPSTAHAESIAPAARPRAVRPGSVMKAHLVGTAGGPIWRQAAGRRGICTVVEVAGARYLVDAGHGSAAGLFGAGLIGPTDGKN